MDGGGNERVDKEAVGEWNGKRWNEKMMSEKEEDEAERPRE